VIPKIITEKGACRGMGPDDFYMDSLSSVNVVHPQPLPSNHICFTCPVREECKEYGLYHEAYGTFGGLTQHELYWERKRLGIKQPSSGIGVIVLNGVPQ
jgi:Transcription factor WhiB